MNTERKQSEDQATSVEMTDRFHQELQGMVPLITDPRKTIRRGSTIQALQTEPVLYRFKDGAQPIDVVSASVFCDVLRQTQKSVGLFCWTN